jgi:type IV pilus assembly protein PilB
MGASDIHFESHENSLGVRFRIDGKLHTMSQHDAHTRDAMLSRLKVLARLDIAEKRLPQDGRIQYPRQDAHVDLRVSTLPTLFGEKLVVRILNHTQSHPSLAELGFEDNDVVLMLRALHHPHGMILMTGPTGSGKTLSLYSCLTLLNRPEVNISTVEDPCEIQLAGINQVTLNERAGLTFATALRALLRQDPDILMVGEIRDLLTAEIAIQAAQTGHLVLSTLHTNSAPATLTRLCHMGISPYMVAASVLLIVAQRLVRTLCALCKSPVSTQEVDLFINNLSVQDRNVLPTHLLQQPHMYEPTGCSHCLHGFKGRVGIYQVLPMDDTTQELMLQLASFQDLTRHSQQQGVRTLRQAGYIKVLQGQTSLQEVMSQTS